ncbi:MAG: hypothetical protein K2M07_00150 [Muribaculaceae bacterium]|nr:hypothetical protein [Muribaculaceae bacterium]
MLKKTILLSLTLFGAVASVYAWKPLFVGHRGSYRGVANTVEAYRNGADYYHYDGLECDVRVTKDGHYVILHDETTGSLCSTDLTVATSTLADLKALKFEQTRGGVKYTGQICTVEEYLDICLEKNVFPVIELKWTTGINSNDMKNFPGLMALVEARGLRSKAIFLTSMLPSLKYVRANYPDVKCQYLLTSSSDQKVRDCVDYELDASFSTVLTEEIAVKYRRAGREVAVWTVNTEANYRKFGKMGTYMMTCDYLVPSDMPELDEPVLPEPMPDPVELDNKILWTRSLSGDNLPANFPDKSGPIYKTGQQAAMVDGKFYVNDYGTKTLLMFDRDCEEAILMPQSDTELGGSPVHGITADDAGNIVLRYEKTYTETPSKVRIFKYGTTSNPVEVEFNLDSEAGGQNNFAFASGDLLSAEGGYLYFLPNKKDVMSLVHIVNGKVESVLTRKLSIQGSTASVIIPIENNPDNFIYMVRNQGFYRYNGQDQGLMLGGSNINPPLRNSSLGGAYMTMGDHEILVYPSGLNYNGGFSIMDITSGGQHVGTFEPLGDGGFVRNSSTGTFMKAEKIRDNVYHLHTYTMGNGYGVYEIKLKGEDSVESVTVPEIEKLSVRVGDGSVDVFAQSPLGNVSVYSVTGSELQRVATTETSVRLNTSSLPRGIYIICIPGKLPVKVVL